MKPRVLVVDDDFDMRLLARIVLAEAGYDVEESTTGEDALDQVKVREPEAILLDLRLPGMDGWGFLEQLRANGHGRVPVIVISAQANPTAQAKARALGCSSYISKPFQLHQLIEEVERAAPRTSTAVDE